MKQRGLDQLVIYCDVEHGGNFAYLVGFFTRFEESLLVINADGQMTLVLGNENLNKVAKARIAAKAVHLSQFSLPNQPNRSDKSIKELLVEAGIRSNTRTGLVGWKMFTDGPEIEKKSMTSPHLSSTPFAALWVTKPACLMRQTYLSAKTGSERSIMRTKLPIMNMVPH
ncbi:hypothetical protein ACQ86O_03980 [Serratia sp. L9]|uniref:hypothetical protein n=1 Tax=Serratia sp. L9 TaxID=3423946 RepID=UPI003D669F89